MTHESEKRIEMIPIAQINVVNPRVRGRRSFEEIAQSIRDVGLKQPVTVARRGDEGEPRYDLVCGQGRLEAYQALGQNEIPAIIEDATPEDCLLKSLVENLARRKHTAADLFHDIAGMKERGHKEKEIAAKTGLNCQYVRGIIRLIERGEERLLQAVQKGQVPITIAVEIADTDEAGAQSALRQAYEKGILRGRKIVTLKRLLAQRQRIGRSLSKPTRRATAALSTADLLRTFQKDADKKRSLIRKAGATRDRLVFVTQALRTLFADENFVNLLRAEGLDTLPRKIAARIQNRGAP